MIRVIEAVRAVRAQYAPRMAELDAQLEDELREAGVPEEAIRLIVHSPYSLEALEERGDIRFASAERREQIGALYAAHLRRWEPLFDEWAAAEAAARERALASAEAEEPTIEEIREWLASFSEEEKAISRQREAEWREWADARERAQREIAMMEWEDQERQSLGLRPGRFPRGFWDSVRLP